MHLDKFVEIYGKRNVVIKGRRATKAPRRLSPWQSLTIRSLIPRLHTPYEDIVEEVTYDNDRTKSIDNLSYEEAGMIITTMKAAIKTKTTAVTSIPEPISKSLCTVIAYLVSESGLSHEEVAEVVWGLTGGRTSSYYEMSYGEGTNLRNILRKEAY